MGREQWFGCEEPTGAALDSDHGSFYNGESDSIAIESTKGSQPTGMITLDYECESIVVRRPVSYSMIVSKDGMSASFDYAKVVRNIAVDQQIRFSADDGIDRDRRLQASTLLQKVSPLKLELQYGATYTDVKFGDSSLIGMKAMGSRELAANARHRGVTQLFLSL